MKKAVKVPSLKEVNAKFLRCCSSGNLDKIKEYLSLPKNHANRIEEGLVNASKKGHLHVVQHLLSLYPDTNTWKATIKSVEHKMQHISQYFLNHHDYNDDAYDTIAVLAAKHNNIEAFIQLLKKKEIDIHCNNELIFTTAIIHKSESFLQYLIYDYDADITPLLSKILDNMQYGAGGDYATIIKNLFANKNLKKTLDKELIIHYEKKSRTKI